MIRSLKQSGDTIVEVLIAIAVLSTVLGGAFAASNRSLKTTRQTQERAEALKVVETQLEKLKALTTNPTPSSGFCFAAESIVTSSAPCEVLVGGIKYEAAIDRDFLLGGSEGYIVRAKWDSITGTSMQDSVEIRYRKK